MNKQQATELTLGQTIYYTGYALTKGVYISSLVRPYNPEYTTVTIGDNQGLNRYSVVYLEDCHVNLDDAYERVSFLKQRRIKSLEKQLAKVKALEPDSLKLTRIFA